MNLRWAAKYDDGSIVNQFGEDGQELSYDNLKDRERVVVFIIYDQDTGKSVLGLNLDPGQKLIYRRRNWARPGEDRPFRTVHLVGWRRTIAGECIQSIAYVFEDGRIELAGKFRENHPLFESPVLRPFEM